jgi:hypothetical protein
LLPHEAAILRTGKALTVRVLREPGAENGVRFPFSGDEEFCLCLTEPQAIGVDQICLSETAGAPVPLIGCSPISALSTAATSELAGATSPSPAEMAFTMPAKWSFNVREPDRADVLSNVIFRVLKEECDAGRPLPSSRGVMRMCRARNPLDITEVTHDEIKFVNGDGDTEVASLEAVSKRVKRMTNF